MVMVELLKIKTQSLAIIKPLLPANIKTWRAPTSLSVCLSLLAISLSSLSSVPYLFLIMDAPELCPIPLCRLDSKAKPMCKCSVLKPDISRGWRINNLAFKWRSLMRRRRCLLIWDRSSGVMELKDRAEIKIGAAFIMLRWMFQLIS